MRSPLRYYGGKFYQAKWIMKQFPMHQCYVEPFCGSAAVYFAKVRKPVYGTGSYMEVLNDIDNRIISFFIKLRDCPEDLIYEQWIVPYSELLYQDPKGYSDEMKTLIQNRLSYGGHLGRKTGFGIKRQPKGGTRPGTWKNLWQLLWAAVDRLKDATTLFGRSSTPMLPSSSVT